MPEIHPLNQLTPIAAKVYMVLSTLASDATPIPLTTLAANTHLSPRSCKRGIAQLRALSLIQILPRRYHQPNTYRLLSTPLRASFPQNTPATPSKTQVGPPQAPLLNTYRGGNKPATPGPFVYTPADLEILNPEIRKNLANYPPGFTERLLQLSAELAERAARAQILQMIKDYANA